MKFFPFLVVVGELQVTGYSTRGPDLGIIHIFTLITITLYFFMYINILVCNMILKPIFKEVKQNEHLNQTKITVKIDIKKELKIL